MITDGDCMDYKEFLRQSMKENEEAVKKLVQEQRQKQIRALSSRSGIPKRFKKCTINNYDARYNPRTKEMAIKFIKEFPNTRGLLLSGPVGTGKTHIAAAIANEMINKLYSVYFGNIVDIMTFIKSTYSNKSDITEEVAINLMTKEVDLLIIDDLGKENSTDHTLSMLYQLINRVYENEKTIIVTTNESSTELKRKLRDKGPAIVSRITEMCEPVILKGKDWRLKK